MKSFTPAEIELLKQNPNTFRVTPNRLYLTLHAKERIVEMWEKHYSFSCIMEELGYDIDVVGIPRAHGLVERAREEAASPYGLHEGYFRAPKRIGISELAELHGEESVSKLKNEVVYLRQEMDFLKKSRAWRIQKSEGNKHEYPLLCV